MKVFFIIYRILLHLCTVMLIHSRWLQDRTFDYKIMCSREHNFTSWSSFIPLMQHLCHCHFFAFLFSLVGVAVYVNVTFLVTYNNRNLPKKINTINSRDRWSCYRAGMSFYLICKPFSPNVFQPRNYNG